MARLAKKYIRQAGGNLKKAWRLQKRSKRGRSTRSRSRKRSSRGNPTTRRSSKLGALISKARGADIVTGPAQGSFAGEGFTKRGFIDAANRYVGGEGQEEITPLSNTDTLKATYGSILTGFGHQKLRSFFRMPQGAGQGKILSIIGQVLPEISAAGVASPLENPKRWNEVRLRMDRAYDPGSHKWDLARPSFAQTLTGTIGLGLISKLISMLGVNRHLPKGVNL